MFTNRKLIIVLVLALAVFSLSTMFVNAGTVVLSDNKGDANKIWFITGEQTLVMNGFDLTPLKLQLPAAIDKITINVEKAVPGAAITAVVYQDSNGGSPIDAVLMGQTQVNITQAGVFTAVFPTPVTITQPVVWLGFYLPPGFQFRADTSGSSVLTYWGWTPGSTFDLNKLSTAKVFGPSDGSGPVNINLGGIARITAEITPGVVVKTAVGTPGTPGAIATVQPFVITTTPGVFLTPVAQANSSDIANLGVMQGYQNSDCSGLLRDTADLSITYRGTIGPICKTIWPGYAPGNPLGYSRRGGLLYDVTFYRDDGLVLSEALPLPVTHCISVPAEELPNAFVGLAFGSPRKWEILPTLRVSNLACAEIYRGGNIAYFVPG
jgi:hypothetical protein